MAVPARKVSKTSQRTRRAHMALTAKQTTKCPSCGAGRGMQVGPVASLSEEDEVRSMPKPASCLHTV